MKKIPFLIIIILVIPLLHAEEWQSYESEHFIFYYQEGCLTQDEITALAQNQEGLFSRITDLLQIEYTGKITYYLYGKREDFEGIPGAYTAGSEIHYLCIFCVDFCKNGLNDAHEMTHALANQIGSQFGLIAEGLAIYVEDYVINGENLHGIVKILYTENRLTSLEDLLEDFWSDILFNYDIAGSFAAFLIEKYGMEKFKELYCKPLGFFSFLEVYGKSLEDLEKEWIQVIQKSEVTQEEMDVVRYRDGIEEGLIIYFDLGFDSLGYGTYPARAEEGICLFREKYKENPEEAFPYLDQFNEGMVAWKEAIETFEEALEQTGYRMKAELFRKATSLYEIAGDEEMLVLSGKYASAYESLVRILEYIEEGKGDMANEELTRVRPLLEELGEESEIGIISQQVHAAQEQGLQGFEVGIVLIFVFVLIIRTIVRQSRK